MNTRLSARQDKLWAYMILPIVVLLGGGILTCGTYYALAAVQPDLVASIPQGQVTFGLYVFIQVVEWAFAISVIRQVRRGGGSAMDLIAPQGDPWRWRWLPAVLVFVGFNGLMAVFISIVRAVAGLAMYEGMYLWQRLFFVTVVPITAGFCEELIWRGYIITRLEARGRGRWATILLAALSFAFIHGSPFHWLLTLPLGILTGYYYVKERKLVPLMISHAVADLWTFGWFLFLV